MTAFMLEGVLISLLCAELRAARERVEVNLLKLQTSEERYRRIIDTAYEGIWIIDAEGRIDYVNQRLAQMLGYNVEEMLSRHIFDFMDNVARIEAEQQMERQKQGIKEQFDFRYRRFDGSDLWAIVSTNPILNEQGEESGAIAMLTDVTERKRTEESLHISEARFRTMFEQSPLSIQILSPDGRTIQVNRAWEQLWGLTLDAISDYNLLEDEQLLTLSTAKSRGILGLIMRLVTSRRTSHT